MGFTKKASKNSYILDTILQNMRIIKTLFFHPTKYRIPFKQLFLNKFTKFNSF